MTHHDQRVTPGIQDWIHISKSTNAIHNSEKLKMKNPYDYPNRYRQSIWQNPTYTPNLKQTLSKLGIEGNFLNFIKCIYKTPSASIILNGKTLNIFLLISVKKKKNRDVYTLTTSIYHCTGGFSQYN